MVASRFASCVDRFVTVPVPETDPLKYYLALKHLAIEENADLFVPVSSPVSSVYDAEMSNHLPEGCRSTSLGNWTKDLDDKVTFIDMAQKAGLLVPDSQRMSSKDAI